MLIAGKRVLVTGAEGFIGSHLVELLVERGAKVVALSLYNSFNDWGWLDTLPCLSHIEVVTGDVRDAHFCTQLLHHIDVAFHLAALIPIPYSYRAPTSFVDTNIAGTLNICQAALAAGTQRLVHVSTSEVYGSARYVPIDESHPLQAQSPYSATKIGADAIATSFHRSFGLPVVIARPFNAYGPRQSARAVIPTIISQLAAGRQSIELGELDTTRDFTFVEDTARGMLALAQMDAGAGEVFNIGSNQEISVGALFQMIVDLMQSTATIVVNQARKRPENSEVLRLWCNNEKLAAACGFHPSTTLRDGLARTIEWFRRPEHLARYKTDIYNV
ncbi:MAG: GDP-mannose 4,6-dehydratase [Acidobacteriota bacterium]|nr:GDP-mannose 4,6-dehydratase [Acidobacteriota bacterium]